MQKKKKFLHKDFFKEIDHLSMLHFIFMMFKDTAPGGKCIEYMQSNTIYNSFEKFFKLFLFINPS